MRSFWITGVLGVAMAASLALGGCSKERSDPTGQDGHPDTWTDTESASFHGTKVSAEGNALCLECHTVVAPPDASEDQIELSCAGEDGCHARAEGPEFLDCETCHDALPESHAAHADDDLHDCFLCHESTVSGGGALVDSVHMNGSKDFALSAVLGGTLDEETLTCSGTYCHGTANTSPEWGTSPVLGCEDCHATADLSALHAEHFGEIDGNCASCHAATAASASTILSGSVTHVNFEVEIQFGPAPGVGGTFDGTGNTCSDTYCHGVSVTTTAWDDPTPLDCEGCHTKAGLPEAHQTHLAVTEDCSVCHSIVALSDTAIATPALHANAEVEVLLSSFAGGSYSDVTRTCGNTNCHGTASPPWGEVAPLDCDGCHHPFDELPRGHQEHFAVIAANCAVCHAATATDSTDIANPANHLNFSVDVQLGAAWGGTFNEQNETCAGTYCHGTAATPAWDGATNLDCESCHAFDALPAPHAKHLANNDDCSQCHAATASSASAIISPAAHANQQVDVQFAVAIGGTYNDVNGTCSDVYCHVSGAPAWVTTPPTLDCGGCHARGGLSANHGDHFDLSAATCATCHAATAVDSTAIRGGSTTHVNFQVDVEASGASAFTYVESSKTCLTSCHGTSSPSWTSTIDLDCQACHADGDLPDPHSTHLTDLGADCSFCHSATVSDGTTIVDQSRHADGDVDVVLDSRAGGTYTSATGTCSDVYCHGSGAPTWATAALDCNSCHPTASLPVSHPAHFAATQMDCERCHAATAVDSTAIGDAAQHVDFGIDVEFKSGFGGTFNGATCNNTYCHGSGVTTTSWSSPTPLDCEGCHTIASLPDGHSVHTAAFDNDCGICHSATASGPTTLVDRGRHADMTNDVVLSATWGGTYDAGSTLQCSNTWCHGPRNTVLSPAWNTSPSLSCEGCHPTAQLSAGHGVASHSIASNCDNCHSLTAASATTLVPDGPHVDNAVDFVPTFSGLAFDGGTNTCTGSCHTPGPSKNWFTLQ